MANEKFLLLTNVSINDVNDRNSSTGKLLKSLFMLGPSPAVMKFGKVSVKSTNQENVNNDSLIVNTSFTIYESYLNYSLKYISERGISSSSDARKNTDTDTPNASDDTNKQEPQSSLKQLSIGTQLSVKLLLKSGSITEGYSEWTLGVNEEVEESLLESIKSALINKQFKTAYDIASKNIESDGLIPIELKTYINSNAPAKVPFIGNCVFSIDSGLTSENSEYDQMVSLGVGPIDARTKSPDEDALLIMNYNVVGDITDGKLNTAFLKLIKDIKNKLNTDTADRYDREETQNEISKFINTKFKNSGKSEDYKLFLTIRDWVESQIKKNNLEPNIEESHSPEKYVKLSEVKNKVYYY